MLVQYTGRLNRASYGKKEIRVYDYVDEQVPVLAAMYRKRLKKGTGLWGLRWCRRVSNLLFFSIFVYTLFMNDTGIVELHRIAENQWKAKYQGNYGVYTIKITTNGKKTVKFSCFFPSDYYPASTSP
jgi:hypothetical protein